MPAISSNTVIKETIATQKYALLAGKDFLIHADQHDNLNALKASWDQLEADKHLKDGATFRLRRFGLFYFLPSTGEIMAMPSTEYFQSAETNTYAGGATRNFAALEEETRTNPFLLNLIKFNFSNFPIESQQTEHPWEVDVHQFRIVGTAEEQGEPTPEGIHHDDDDFNVIHLMQRKNAKGGMNTVHANDKELIASTTLEEVMDSVYVWDPHVMHGVTPIYPQDPAAKAIRDVLVIGYNASPDLARPA